MAHRPSLKKRLAKARRFSYNRHTSEAIVDRQFDFNIKDMAKKDKKLAEILRMAYDRCEGLYSRIPECCIDAYLGGLRAKNYMDSPDPKIREKYKGWEYVPCAQCFQEEKKAKIKKNGVSFQGRIILQLLQYFRGQRR